MRNVLLMALAMSVAVAHAEEVFPRKDWKDRPNPLASPDAVVGGEFVVFVGQYPKSFNYFLDPNTFSAELFGALYESLLTQHPLTLELEPGLAARWSISDDRKTFTFWINPEARWSDGQPVTAHDAKWTFDAIMNPKHLTGPFKVDLERFESVEVMADDQVRFTAREVHWKNHLAVAFLRILPKHAYENLDFNKINFELPVVSGPYRLGEIKEGFYAKIERRDDWWQKERLSVKGTGNFKTLKFMFFQEQDNAFDALKKGLIDFFPVYTAHRWVAQTSGERFDQNWIVKQKVHNYEPIGFQGFAMNTRRPPFDDVRVRRALAHALNREKMNSTLMHNQYFLHRSYFEDLYDVEHPCPNEVIPFDKEKARALLEEAGWKAGARTGILEKDGRPFKFSFLTRDTATDKFLVIYKEDLKDIGIEMNLDQKDWAAWAKDMDEFNFHMTWAAWSGGLWKDPEAMWSSAEADRPGGQNYTGFKHPRVDALIAQQRAIFNLHERNAICREIDKILTAEVPYVLLWNLNYKRLLYWNKFGMPDTVLDKYGDERAAYWYWWYDEDAAADLEDAMKNQRPLPRKPESVVFDEAFRARE